MKTLQKRAIICLMFAALLILGTGFYTYKLVNDGGQWVSYPANSHIFTNGKLTTGVIKDRNGETLVYNNANGATSFSGSYGIRTALVHTTGDLQGNISTGANVVFRDKMVGYNLVTGVYSLSGQGRTINLTLDAGISKYANELLAGRSGTIGVYNYKTGEIVCMVSSPNFDPADPPTISADDKSGIYLNRFTSATIVPGSIFKVVTANAALETIDNIDDWSYYCTGSKQYGSYSKDRITCLSAHGNVDLEEALADSCNCAFGALAIEIGPEKLKEYTQMSGLMNSYDLQGIHTKESTFEFNNVDIDLAWTGIGQHKDLVNPCAMMVYMGAIGGDGQAAKPRLIEDIQFANGLPAGLPFKSGKTTLVNADTAEKLQSMMRNNVEETYGEWMFPGLNICAKSGTAEGSKTDEPHAWFAGFLDDPDNPYAFIVLVENGGYGTEVAGTIANSVLQEIVD